MSRLVASESRLSDLTRFRLVGDVGSENPDRLVSRGTSSVSSILKHLLSNLTNVLSASDSGTGSSASALFGSIYENRSAACAACLADDLLEGDLLGLNDGGLAICIKGQLPPLFRGLCVLVDVHKIRLALANVYGLPRVHNTPERVLVRWVPFLIFRGLC